MGRGRDRTTLDGSSKLDGCSHTTLTLPSLPALPVTIRPHSSFPSRQLSFTSLCACCCLRCFFKRHIAASGLSCTVLSRLPVSDFPTIIFVHPLTYANPVFNLPDVYTLMATLTDLDNSGFTALPFLF